MRFFKYSGSGNDFILVNNLDAAHRPRVSLIQQWCKRREGVGADGVIFIEKSNDHDYGLRIWNADGSEAEMCGNAARSSIHFAHHILKMGKEKYYFETMNGDYEGRPLQGDNIEVKMTELYDVDKINISDFSTKGAMYCNTGVPHAVIQVNSVEDINIHSLGRMIRNDVRFPNGTNVDFLEVVDHKNQVIKLRVYERGVEDETLCCGTGVMAAAVTCRKLMGWTGEITVHAKGGQLSAVVDDKLENLYFQGEVKMVFEGELGV
ncbi:MAG: diaminopimelate epimerase [Bacteriovoracaceae bacterium]|nr:diaminopimelate epimerase [Bacteriovoracaceae bacterium]